MKKFVELIERIHKERFSVVMSKIVTEKIPVAFLSLSPIENVIDKIYRLIEEGVNITNLITGSSIPNLADKQFDINIAPLNKISTIQPRPKYIFTVDPTDARISVKYAPDCITLFIALNNTGITYETFMNNLTELKKVYESLIDEESKKTFYGWWLGNISQNFGELVYSNNHHYILEGFIPKRDDILIDVGAYDGGTAAYFSDMGYKVYAFEMDKKNFDNAKPIAEEKNFVLENLGLGSFKHEMRYTSKGSMSKFNQNGDEVAQITTLDSYVRENDIQHVDFIKFDVEGAELEVLQGATTTISRFKPILALSAYHKKDDFWTLMNFVKSVRSDYEFAMRQYRSSLEDLPPSESDFKLENYLYSLGLDVKVCWYNECILFAR